MCKDMNSFSFNRFGKTLRWVMAVNFRTLLMWTIGSVVAVFVGELMSAEIGRYSADEMVRLYGTMGCALFILVSLIMASTIVSSVNEKCKRQAFLMMRFHESREVSLAAGLYLRHLCGLRVLGICAGRLLAHGLVLD